MLARMGGGLLRLAASRAQVSTVVTPCRRQHGEGRDARLAFLADMEAEYQPQHASDWRKVTLFEIKSRPGGEEFLKHYDGSLHAALVDLKADFAAPAAMCTRKVPATYWDSPTHRVEFMRAVAEEQKVEAATDWARVGRSTVEKLGGRQLLRSHSMQELIAEAFPEHARGSQEQETAKARGHWQEEANRRRFMDELADSNGIESPADWAKVTAAHIREAGGRGLLAHHNESVRSLLAEYLGEGHVAAHYRPVAPTGYWSDPANRRSVAEATKQRLGISQPGDWAKVTLQQWREASPLAGGLLYHYNDSLFALIRDLYGPDADVKLFEARPNTYASYWEEEDNIRAFLEYVKREMRISAPQEWARVSVEQIKELGGGVGYLRNVGSLEKGLRIAYPTVRWDDINFNLLHKKASQRCMRLVLENLFPPSTGLLMSQ